MQIPHFWSASDFVDFFAAWVLYSCHVQMQTSWPSEWGRYIIHWINWHTLSSATFFVSWLKLFSDPEILLLPSPFGRGFSLSFTTWLGCHPFLKTSEAASSDSWAHTALSFVPLLQRSSRVCLTLSYIPICFAHQSVESIWINAVHDVSLHP